MKKQQDINKSLDGFLDKLNPSDAVKTRLRKAQGLIRARLRQGMPDARYMTQGSYRCGTMNRPCHQPPQQMDLDDGMYIPRSVVEKTGLSCSQLLAQVDEYLRPLAIEQGWSAPQVKHSCVRIEIDEDKHVDIPLYQAADSELKDISDHTPSGGGGKHAEIYREWGVLGYFGASTAAVELATNQGWKPSDSRNIIEWVADCRADYGPRFIRISRILKGWRDHQWQEKSPLPSILIMAMVATAMREACISANSTESDDQALWDVVSVIADTVVYQEIKDPDESVDEPLTGKWTDAERDECARRFDALRRALDKVLGGGGGIEELRKQFGKFFPSDASLIKPCAIKKPAAVAAATATTAAAARPYGASAAYDDFLFHFRWMMAMAFNGMKKRIAAAIDYFSGVKFNSRRLLAIVIAVKELIAAINGLFDEEGGE